ncbi:MAG: hypothetical protein AAF629_00160 [Chloroflexota bacterium]
MSAGPLSDYQFGKIRHSELELERQRPVNNQTTSGHSGGSVVLSLLGLIMITILGLI